MNLIVSAVFCFGETFDEGCSSYIYSKYGGLKMQPLHAAAAHSQWRRIASSRTFPILLFLADVSGRETIRRLLWFLLP